MRIFEVRMMKQKEKRIKNNMAIKFQYNKTSLNNIGKQLKMRQKALPTLKNKESALRIEVRNAKD